MPRTSPRIVLSLLALVVTVVAVGGCSSQPAAAPARLTLPPLPPAVKYSDVRPEDLIPPAPGDYRVQSGDVLEIRIGDLVAPGVENAKLCRVSATGYISLPLVPPIYVAGMTEAQINAAVRWAFRNVDL